MVSLTATAGAAAPMASASAKASVITCSLTKGRAASWIATSCPFCRAQTVDTLSARVAPPPTTVHGLGQAAAIAWQAGRLPPATRISSSTCGWAAKSRHTSFQHGFAAGQAVTEFIESHSAGSPRRHNDSADFYLGIFFHKMTPLADVFPRFAHKAWYCLSALCSAAILLNLLYRP